MRIRIAALSVLALLGLAGDLFAQNDDPGKQAFETRCARCHGADGNGGEMGPPIATRLPPLDDQQLIKTIREGNPTKGMPPTVGISESEIADLVKYLRTIERRSEPAPIVRGRFATTDGRSLEGQILNEGFDDLQVRTDDKRVHLLRRAGDSIGP